MSRWAGRKANELKEGLRSIHALCLHGFPEFLADVRIAGLGKGAHWTRGVHDLGAYAAKHLNACGSHKPRPSSALRGCWLCKTLRAPLATAG